MIIRNGILSEQFFRIESKPIGFLRFDKQLIIAGMNQTLNSFYMKGKKNYSITMSH